jgi:hypothetical protein
VEAPDFLPYIFQVPQLFGIITLGCLTPRTASREIIIQAKSDESILDSRYIAFISGSNGDGTRKHNLITNKESKGPSVFEQNTYYSRKVDD